MVTEPADTPVIVPDASMVAIAGLLLLQTPPAVASLKEMVLFAQSDVLPVIAATIGKAFTITVVFEESLHPFASVKLRK